MHNLNDECFNRNLKFLPDYENEKQTKKYSIH